MSAYADCWWNGPDGLRLHYRDYPGEGAADRPVLLCLPGLTRNARDFDALARWASSSAGGGWRVLAPDLRGRGQSGWAEDPLTYTPAHYIADVWALLDGLGVARVVVVGTSLGGLMAMAMGMARPGLIAGAVLNDVGPVVAGEGLAKIATYLGLDPRFADWDTLADDCRATFAAAFPDWQGAEWLAMAHRVGVEDGEGGLRHDYDPAIAVPFGQPAAPLPDLWPGLEALGAGPLLIVRGELSDILSVETLEAMRARAPGARVVSLPRTGHPPTLDEPAARAAIARLLEDVR